MRIVLAFIALLILLTLNTLTTPADAAGEFVITEQPAGPGVRSPMPLAVQARSVAYRYHCTADGHCYVVAVLPSPPALTENTDCAGAPVTANGGESCSGQASYGCAGGGGERLRLMRWRPLRRLFRGSCGG